MSFPKFFYQVTRSRLLSRRSCSFGLLPFAALFLLGCPGGAELEDSEAHLGSCAPLIFETRCAGAACHSPGENDQTYGGVDLISPGVEERLYDQLATYPVVMPACRDGKPVQKLIDPAAADESLLLLKVYDTFDHNCGDAMPTGPSLDETDLECLDSWVLSIINDRGAVNQ